MMRSIKLLLLCLFAFPFWGSALFAGTGNPTPGDSSMTGKQLTKDLYFLENTFPDIHELNIWAGHAFDSWRVWGKTPDTQLSQLGLRYNRKFLRFKEHILEYVVEIDLYSHYDYPAYEPRTGRVKVSGFGIVPVGFQLNFNGNSTIQPFLKTTGGLMFLDGPFPDERGTKFNFTYDAGGGLEFIIAKNTSITLGYRFYHLSNWFTGQVNPGVDSNFFYFGVTVF